MNAELREMLAEEMGLSYCPIVNTYVDNDCFKCCDTCKDNIEFMEYYKEIENNGKN